MNVVMAFSPPIAAGLVQNDGDSIDFVPPCFADFREGGNGDPGGFRNHSTGCAFWHRDGHSVGHLGSFFMRVFFGIILGVALTVGVTFLADTWSTGPPITTGSASAAVEQHQMVNWDVVSDRMRLV